MVGTPGNLQCGICPFVYPGAYTTLVGNQGVSRILTFGIYAKVSLSDSNWKRPPVICFVCGGRGVEQVFCNRGHWWSESNMEWRLYASRMSTESS